MNEAIYGAHVRTESNDRYNFGYWEQKPDKDKLSKYLEEEINLYLPRVDIYKMEKSDIDIEKIN